MSRENVSGRTLAERAGVRWPTVLPLATQSALRLPQGSRVRRAMLRRAARAAFDAWNRGDFDLVPHIDDPGVETHITLKSGAPIGFDPVYYGPEGHCHSMEIWNEAWRKWDAQIEELIEEGRERIVIVARISAEGSTSGVKLEEWGAVRYTFGEGRITRVDAAFDPDRDWVLDAMVPRGGEAREAAGLSE